MNIPGDLHCTGDHLRIGAVPERLVAGITDVGQSNLGDFVHVAWRPSARRSPEAPSPRRSSRPSLRVR
jgi:glycine cleavage system H lipoate-binding protein